MTGCFIVNLFRDFDLLFIAVAKVAVLLEPLARGKAPVES